MSQNSLSEIRRSNLLFLIEQYGSIKRLNLALGRKEKDATLSQIKNKAPSSKTGAARQMGVAVARDIEKKLNYPFGWMDEEHPEIQPEPQGTGEINLKLGEKHKTTSLFTVIPLFEIRKRTTDGKFVPFRIGEIEMPNIFLERSAYPIEAEKALSFYVDELTANDFVSFGSIIVLDKSVKNYSKDGLYLVEINGNVFFRKIISSAKGGFIVQSSLSNSEHVQDLENLRIIGLCVFCWVQQPI